MKRLIACSTLFVIIAATFGCDKDEPIPIAQPEEIEPFQEEVEETRQEGNAVLPEGHPAIKSVTTATFEMKLWADAPDDLRQAVGDGVLLQYTNFPGHFEVFAETTVKDCILAYEKKPFNVKFMRYQFADDNTYTRAVAFDACPNVSSEKLARQWLEAENLREKFAESEATHKAFTTRADPQNDAAGWAGRGFYRVDGSDPGKTPADQEWKTFCGEKSGTPCDDVPWDD